MGGRNRIRIGNQTSFSAPYAAAPFEFAVEAGFDAFEWFPDKRDSGEGWTETDLGDEERAAIRKSAADHDIRLSVHASWQASPLLEESHERLSRQSAFARDTGASILNIHLDPGQGIGRFIDAIIPLVLRLSEAGMMLSVENTPDTTPEDFNELFERLASRTDVPFSSIGMCLDLGHANLCDGTRNDYLAYIDRLGPQVPIIHVHLHENWGDSDDHLTVFTGPAARDTSGIEGFLGRLKKRRYAGSIILEQWPRPPELLKEARSRLLVLLGKDQNGGGNIPGPADSKPERGSKQNDDAFAARLIDGDRETRSWREKLGLVYDLLTEESAPDAGKLTYLAIYLRFVRAGEVPSQEEGGHHRPSHHAGIASRIHDRLAELEDSGNSFIIRKIYPSLPSFNSDFTRTEPLTRIRDIAHRNDIPRELKTEIKHTLQNKLHRNAGPEDLATSKALLERITSAESRYPDSFVAEFRRFHEELEEFFNARSLDEDLETLASGPAKEDAGLTGRFLEAKRKANGPGQALQTLELLTELRRSFADRASGKGAEAQRFQIADIRLEDVSFVLMSRLAGNLRAGETDWPQTLRSLPLCVEGLRLSGFDAGECLAVEAELKAVNEVFDPKSHEQLLRLKASLERCSRLAEDYSARILSLFPEKAEKLGAALGVPADAVRVFGEADIRRHPVFQLNRIIAALLREIRRLAGLPPWEILVPGTASGILLRIPGLTAIGDDPADPVIALAERVEGDEVIPARVTAVIAAHQVPHLSHLAVRARQRGIVFAACEDAESFEKIAAAADKPLLIDAGGRSVFTWNVLPGRMELDAGGIATPAAVPLHEVDLRDGGRLLPLNQVTVRNGGSKAFRLRQLDELARRREAGFSVPPAVVVPFGAMEEALRMAGEDRRYTSLLWRVGALEHRELDDALKELRHVISRLRLPENFSSGIKNGFSPDERLMVRSSSSAEDLERFSGAGLYETIANVPPADAQRAVKAVWASLWTRRATIGRRNYGIPHDGVRMAVVVQKMLAPELSFIIHTRNPVTGDAGEVYMELAIGLGEGLASGRMHGTPYRLVFDKRSDGLRILSFASFSHAVKAQKGGGLREETVDYSKTRFTCEPAYRQKVATLVGRAGCFAEEAFGKPQDIEGLVRDERVWLVQARTQDGGSR